MRSSIRFSNSTSRRTPRPPTSWPPGFLRTSSSGSWRWSTVTSTNAVRRAVPLPWNPGHHHQPYPPNPLPSPLFSPVAAPSARLTIGPDDYGEHPPLVGPAAVALMSLADLRGGFGPAEVGGHGRVAHQPLQKWEIAL